MLKKLQHFYSKAANSRLIANIIFAFIIFLFTTGMAMTSCNISETPSNMIDIGISDILP